jgi:hypothetical protein
MRGKTERVLFRINLILKNIGTFEQSDVLFSYISATPPQKHIIFN